MIEIGKVLESTGALIKIKLNDVESFEDNKESLKVGKYLTIQEGNLNYILATILNIKTIDGDDIQYYIETQPIGSYTKDDSNVIFKQGSINIPSPTEPVYITSSDIVDKIFSPTETASYYMGRLVLV